MHFVLRVTFALAIVTPNEAMSQDLNVEIDEPARALGIVTARLRVDGRPRIAGLRLACSSNSPGGYCPRQGDIPFASIEFDSDETTLLVPLSVVRMDRSYALMFVGAGTYDLTWTLSIADQPALTHSHSLKVAPASTADESFLEEAASTLLGNEWSEIADDIAFAHIIQKLLAATEGSEPFEGMFKSKPEFERWCDATGHLAQQYAESSFAPYAAFFSGSGRASFLAETSGPDADITDPAARQQLSIAEARIRFASEQGDPYLVPRALIQSFRTEAIRGNWVNAAGIATNIRRLAGDQGSIAELLQKAETETTRLRERRETRRP